MLRNAIVGRIKNKMNMLKPIIKYSGSKFPYLNDINNYLPKSYNKVLIPFLGGGSFLSLFQDKEIIASDINPSVVGIFRILQKTPDRILESYEYHYNQTLLYKEEYYLKIRERYNTYKYPLDFLYLTRTCYNGLIRYNSAGNFNVGFHHNRTGIEPSKFYKIVSEWHQHISRASISFLTEYYLETTVKASAKDLVLLDPPYILTKGQYLADHFNFDEFSDELTRLDSKGCSFVCCLDHDSKLVSDTIKNSDNYILTNTSIKSSSFSRLKNQNIYNGNTILYNKLLT